MGGQTWEAADGESMCQVPNEIRVLDLALLQTLAEPDQMSQAVWCLVSERGQWPADSQKCAKPPWCKIMDQRFCDGSFLPIPILGSFFLSPGSFTLKHEGLYTL